MSDDGGVNFFVYGTLKQGQCRQGCWPFEPLGIVSAWTFGRLFDLGPYPAMISGEDRVAGEVWTFPKEHASSVLKTLDAVEVTNQPGQENLFNRQEATVYLKDGNPVPAYLYTYADVDALSELGKPVEPQRRLQTIGAELENAAGRLDVQHWSTWPVE